MSGKTYIANSKITSSMIGDDMALMDVKGGTYFTLNAVGASIWKALESPKTEDALVAHVTDIFQVEEAECREDVAAILAELEEEGLVEESN